MAVYNNARPWRQQYGINNQDPGGDLSTWTSGTTLDVAVTEGQVIVTKSRAYLLGGFNVGGDLDTVRTATIDANGVIGSWSALASKLVCKTYASQAAVIGGYVYLFGGGALDASGPLATVQRAAINGTDGTIGDWAATTSLPVGLSHSQVVVTRNKVYLLGGTMLAGATDKVYVASIDPDTGSIGSWVEDAGTLPLAIRQARAITTLNRVYLLGGFTTAVSPAVLTAPINESGEIGSFSFTTSLPYSRYAGQSFVIDKYVYYMGGYGTAASDVVVRAPIDDTGIIGTWADYGGLGGNANYRFEVLLTSTKLYVLGGASGPSTYLSTTRSTPFPGGYDDYSALGVETSYRRGSIVSYLDVVAGTGETPIVGFGSITPPANSVTGQGKVLVYGTGTVQPAINAVYGTGLSLATNDAAVASFRDSVKATGWSAAAGAGRYTPKRELLASSGWSGSEVAAGAVSPRAERVASQGAVPIVGTGSITGRTQIVSGSGDVQQICTGSGRINETLATVTGWGGMAVTANGSVSDRKAVVSVGGYLLVSGSGVVIPPTSNIKGGSAAGSPMGVLAFDRDGRSPVTSGSADSVTPLQFSRE